MLSGVQTLLILMGAIILLFHGVSFFMNGDFAQYMDGYAHHPIGYVSSAICLISLSMILNSFFKQYFDDSVTELGCEPKMNLVIRNKTTEHSENRPFFSRLLPDLVYEDLLEMNNTKENIEKWSKRMLETLVSAFLFYCTWVVIKFVSDSNRFRGQCVGLP